MEFVTCGDGSMLGVEILGSRAAPPVIVIPGGPCRDPSYLGDLAGLAAVRPLAVVHLRGTQASGGLSHGWWADAADAIAVADHLGLESFDMLAHSAGTRLALATAAQHPARVRSLALVTPPAAWLTGADHDGASLAAARDEPEIAKALASMQGTPPSDEGSFQRAIAVEAPAGYAHWTATERAHAELGGMTLEAAEAWFSAIPADAAQQIKESRLPPTLVLAGAADILSGVEPVRAYAQALGARLRLVDGCGHYPWVEQPAAFRDALDDWLLDARGGSR